MRGCAGESPGNIGFHDHLEEVDTVNVDIFALYIFSHNSRFLDMRENMYPSKIMFIIDSRTSCT